MTTLIISLAFIYALISLVHGSISHATNTPAENPGTASRA